MYMPPHLGHKKEIIEITFHTENDEHVFRIIFVFWITLTHILKINKAVKMTTVSPAKASMHKLVIARTRKCVL